MHHQGLGSSNPIFLLCFRQLGQQRLEITVDDNSQRKRRPPRKISPRYLERVVGHYLNRYTTTTAHLRRLLGNRVRRSAAHHETSVAEGMAMVDALIEKLVEQGYMDDQAWARSRAHALHRRGNGLRAIRSKLSVKGIRGPLLDETLQWLRDELGDPDRIAAWRYAKKRRIDPSVVRKSTPMESDASSPLARAGFSYAVASTIVSAESVPEALMPAIDGHTDLLGDKLVRLAPRSAPR